MWGGGSDFHANMHSVEDYRRYLLNGIIWTAKIDVPAAGVVAPAPPALWVSPRSGEQGQLADVYQRRSKYVAMFISKRDVAKTWSTPVDARAPTRANAEALRALVTFYRAHDRRRRG